jgi:hypothetical protein
MSEVKKPLPANLEKLARSKKKPSDWVFVPRRKKFKQCPVMIQDGKTVLVSDGGGALKPQTLEKPLIIKVTAVRGTDAKGNLLGGYRPQQERDLSAEKVLEKFLDMSANPNCEVVPYELREVGKEAMVAEMNLVEERNRRLEAEEKLKALEDGKSADAQRIKELEAALADKGKK